MRGLIIGLSALVAGCQSQEPIPEPTPNEVATTSAVPSSTNEAGTPYSAPADPNASYSLISVKPGANGKIIAMTQRVGPSGTSYSNREIDCEAQLARYIGEGDTLAEANELSPNPGEMSPLVDGSSTWAAVQAACSNR